MINCYIIYNPSTLQDNPTKKSFNTNILFIQLFMFYREMKQTAVEIIQLIRKGRHNEKAEYVI